MKTKVKLGKSVRNETSGSLQSSVSNLVWESVYDSVNSSVRRLAYESVWCLVRGSTNFRL